MGRIACFESPSTGMDKEYDRVSASTREYGERVRKQAGTGFHGNGITQATIDRGVIRSHKLQSCVNAGRPNFAQQPVHGRFVRQRTPASCPETERGNDSWMLPVGPGLFQGESGGSLPHLILAGQKSGHRTETPWFLRKCHKVVRFQRG